MVVLLPTKASFSVVERGLSVGPGEPYSSPQVAPSGRVERWSSGAWTAVAQVSIAQERAHLDVELPALTRGTYRLVTTEVGTADEIAGPFWVITDRGNSQ